MTENKTAGVLLGTAALRERGWSPSMIRDLLGDPDETRPNPFYRSAAPAKLYDLSRVTAAEASGQFTDLVLKAKRRSSAASAAAGRKRDALLAEIKTVTPHVPVLGREGLTRKACASYNRHQAGSVHRDWAPDFDPASPGSDPLFLERITVNYLRHELTGYEEHLQRVAGRTGVRDAEKLIRRQVYEAIAAAYPDLAAECLRQLARRAEGGR